MTEFPIYGDETQFRVSGAAKIRGIRPGHFALIDSVQPYKRGDDYIIDPLWVLHELARIDRHRAVHLAGHAIQEASLAVTPYGGQISSAEIIPGAFVDGAPVARIGVIPTYLAQPKMHVEFVPTFGVTYEEGGCSKAARSLESLIFAMRSQRCRRSLKAILSSRVLSAALVHLSVSKNRAFLPRLRQPRVS